MDSFYRQLVTRLKARYSGYSISVRRVVLSDVCGDCERRTDGSFLIRVAKSKSLQEQCDTLIHEFPHVPAWNEWVKTHRHGSKWSENYRICYEIYEQLIEEQPYA